MNDETVKLLIAQQVVILQRLEKLAKEIKGGLRSAPVQTYVDELRRDAEKIVGQIKYW